MLFFLWCAAQLPPAADEGLTSTPCEVEPVSLIAASAWMRRLPALLLAAASLAGLCAHTARAQELRFREDGSFSICQLTDQHFGEGSVDLATAEVSGPLVQRTG